MKLLFVSWSKKPTLLWWCLWAVCAMQLLAPGGANAENVDASVVPVDKSSDPTVTDLLYLDVHQRLSKESIESRPLGTVVIGLFGTIVPKTVENFKGLAATYERTHTLFHRVIPGFVIQAGDIDNQGGHSIYGEKGAPPPKDADPHRYGPLYSGLEDENFILSHNKLGRVSVANAGPNTGGSQFFICMEPQPGLDGSHVVFGQVLQGMNVAEQISGVDRDLSDKPLLDVFIQAARTEPYTDAALLSKSAAEGESTAGGTGGAVTVTTSTDGQTQQQQGSNQAYAEDHPSGMGGSYHHYVFVPFTVFIFIAGLMAYKNRRNVSMMVRGPRYRRVSGMNV